MLSHFRGIFGGATLHAMGVTHQTTTQTAIAASKARPSSGASPEVFIAANGAREPHWPRLTGQAASGAPSTIS